jgi:vitamin B12 transporter
VTYRNLLLVSCGFVLTAAGAAYAQGVPPVAEQPANGMVTEVVVTANRTPVHLDQVGQSVTVLNQRAIELSQTTTVTELLSQTPGVTFVRNGGAGKTTSLFIRGAEAGQTVVLIDGVRLNDPSSPDTGASLSDIVSGNIERIEVLRGAQSTLYGSQAIGGVINIITATPARPLEVYGQAEAGSFKTSDLRSAVGGADGRLIWRAGANYFTTKGVSAYAPGTERDGYHNTSLHGKLGYAFSDHVSLDLRAFYTRGYNDFDNFNADGPVWGINKQLLTYAGLNFGLFDDRLKNRVSYSNTDITRVNYDRSPARTAQPVTFDAAGKSDRYEYQGTFKASDIWRGVFGVEYQKDHMRTASPTVAVPRPASTRASDSTQGYYLQVQGEVLEGLMLTGGVRYEDQSVFGGHTVGSAAAAYSINNGETVFRASWGQGFKAPSLYQLYSDYGNLGLNPEEAESWDIGFEHHLMAGISVSAVYFSRDTTNLIQFNSCTSATASNPLCAAPRTGFYSNVGRVHAEGEEFGASASSGPFSASLNYTHLRAINTTRGDPNRHKRLVRRPNDAVNATASYVWLGKLTTSATLRYVGATWNDAGNTQKLKHYTLVDLRASYQVNPNVELYGRIENAFNEKYQTVLDYGTTGVGYYAGVRLRY